MNRQEDNRSELDLGRFVRLTDQLWVALGALYRWCWGWKTMWGCHRNAGMTTCISRGRKKRRGGISV
jgi:hypothetical protein